MFHHIYSLHQSLQQEHIKQSFLHLVSWKYPNRKSNNQVYNKKI